MRRAFAMGKQAEFWSESKTTAKSTVNRKRNHASLRNDLTAQLTRTHKNVCVLQISRKSSTNQINFLHEVIKMSYRDRLDSRSELFNHTWTRQNMQKAQVNGQTQQTQSLIILANECKNANFRISYLL